VRYRPVTISEAFLEASRSGCRHRLLKMEKFRSREARREYGLHLFEGKRNYPADYNDIGRSAGSAQSGADLAISLGPGIAQRDRIAGLLLAR